VRKTAFFTVTKRHSSCYIGLLTKRNTGRRHNDSSFAKKNQKILKLRWGKFRTAIIITYIMTSQNLFKRNIFKSVKTEIMHSSTASKLNGTANDYVCTMSFLQTNKLLNQEIYFFDFRLTIPSVTINSQNTLPRQLGFSPAHSFKFANLPHNTTQI